MNIFDNFNQFYLAIKSNSIIMRVEDPYIWMEDLNNPRLLKWVDDENIRFKNSWVNILIRLSIELGSII